MLERQMIWRSVLQWDLVLGTVGQALETRSRSLPHVGKSPRPTTRGSDDVCIHLGDAVAARGPGLRTGFIYRPGEYGRVRKADAARVGAFDVVAESILDLASKMDA